MTLAALKAPARQLQLVPVRDAAHEVRPKSAIDAKAGSGPVLPRFATSLAALPALPVVRRRCTECESKDEPGATVQPSLEVGPANDRFEREADAIAAQTLAMPAGDLAAAAATDPHVQRKCTECGEEEQSVRTLRAAPTEGTRIGASVTRLTTGGQALPDATRDFFEARMGRDLCSVRVHGGGQAAHLNGSIAARAFTYGSHIWLGRGETADTGFTMAHELAHVLQQTQPGQAAGHEAGAEASAAAPVIQRASGDLRAFWLPESSEATKERTPGDILALHTVIHNKAVEALAKINGGIITEAPIPNATAGNPRSDHNGWADLFQANSIIGLNRTCADEPDVNSCLAELTPSKADPGFRVSQKGGSPFRERAPNLSAMGDITDLSKAPDKIQIGDMKPGHNRKASEDGVKQINNYFEGITRLVKAVNHQQAINQETARWKLSPARHLEKDDVKIPDGWDATKDHGTGIYNLELRYHGKTYRLTKGTGSKQRVPLKGRWVLAKHPNLAGIWVYFMRPDDASLKTAFGRKVETVEIQTVGKKLKTVLDDLAKPPQATKAPKAVKPRRLPASASVRVARAAPAVRRQPSKTTSSDTSFDFARWNETRVGKAKPDGTSFKEVFEAKFPEPEQEAVIFKGGAAESITELQDLYGGLGLEKPAMATEMITGAAEIRKFRFWAGADGWVIGRLRSIFGGLFVKVVLTAQKIRDKISDKLKSFSFKSSGGVLKGAAMKIGGIVIKYIAGWVVRRTVDALTQCLQIGVQRKIEALISGTVIETLEEKIEEIKAFVEKTKDDVIDDVETFAESIIGPIRKQFDDYAEDIKIIGQIVSVVKTALNAGRVGACLLGGLETIGISCILALLDFAASLAGISPVEYFASKILDSCTVKEKLAGLFSAIDFVEKLPVRLAGAIVEGVKGLLPEWARDVLCDPEKDLVVQPFTTADYNCDDVGKFQKSEEKSEQEQPPGGNVSTPPGSQGQNIDPAAQRPGPTSLGGSRPVPGGENKPVGKNPDDRGNDDMGGTPATSNRPVDPKDNAPPHTQPVPPKPGSKQPDDTVKPDGGAPGPMKGDGPKQNPPSQGQPGTAGKGPADARPGPNVSGGTPAPKDEGGQTPGAQKQQQGPSQKKGEPLDDNRAPPDHDTAPGPVKDGTGEGEGGGGKDQKEGSGGGGRKGGTHAPSSVGAGGTAEGKSKTKPPPGTARPRPEPRQQPQPGTEETPGQKPGPKSDDSSKGTQSGQQPADKPGDKPGDKAGDHPAKTPDAPKGAGGKPGETPDTKKPQEQPKPPAQGAADGPSKNKVQEVPPVKDGKAPDAGGGKPREQPDGGKDREQPRPPAGGAPGEPSKSKDDGATPPAKAVEGPKGAPGQKPVTPDDKATDGPEGTSGQKSPAADDKAGEQPKPIPGGQPKGGQSEEGDSGKEDDPQAAKRIPRLMPTDVPEGFKPDVFRHWWMTIESGLPSVAEVRRVDPRECLERVVTARVSVDNPNVEFTITLTVEFCTVAGPNPDGLYEYSFYFRYDIFIEDLQLLIPARPGKEQEYIYRGFDPGPPGGGETA